MPYYLAIPSSLGRWKRQVESMLGRYQRSHKRWARRLSRALVPVVLVGTAMATNPALAETYLVKDQKAYNAAVNGLEPGDELVLANGTWRDFEILFQGSGTETAPITLAAETSGQVIISGRSNLRIAGEHLIVKGLTFTDGHTPTAEVIAFRLNAENLANHTRLTEIVIDGFNKTDRTEQVRQKAGRTII